MAKKLEREHTLDLNAALNSFNEKSLSESIASLKDTIIHTLVYYGWYALTVTLGMWGALALAAMIPNVFFAWVVLIFGMCVAVFFSLMAAEALANHTTEAASWAFDKCVDAFAFIKSKITSEPEPVTMH